MTETARPDSRAEPAMKKAVTLILDHEEIIELYRILLDEDPEGALAFLKTHLKGQVRNLLEGG